MFNLRGTPHLACATAMLSAGALSMPAQADAAYLYWTSFGVRSGSITTCLTFADSVMRQQSFTGIRRLPIEVSGSLGGMYAAITCIASPSRATAVVMVIGDDGTAVVRTRDSLRDQIANMVCFDSPC